MAVVLGTQSTVWAQLAVPQSAQGSLPFVFTDGVTIATDVANLEYDQTNLRLVVTNGLEQTHGDISAIPGAAGVVNNSSGRFSISTGTTVFVLTNTLAAAGDIVLFTKETLDATLTSLKAVAGAGIITFTGNAPATGNTTIAFVLQKVR